MGLSLMLFTFIFCYLGSSCPLKNATDNNMNVACEKSIEIG